jgi:hypothetical protein
MEEVAGMIIVHAAISDLASARAKYVTHGFRAEQLSAI